MTEQDPPDDDAPESPPGTARERFRSRIESVIPEILKRAVEIGVEKARESPDNLKQFAQDMKLPKEVAHYLLQQIDETKNGLFRVVAKEMRDFLEHTNFAGELQKILTTVQFEVNTTIRFTPNDGRDPPRSKTEPPEGDGTETPETNGDRGDEVDGEPHERGQEPRESVRTPLPRPEVKTAVHVRRDDRGSGRRRNRGA